MAAENTFEYSEDERLSDNASNDESMEGAPSMETVAHPAWDESSDVEHEAAEVSLARENQAEGEALHQPISEEGTPNVPIAEKANSEILSDSEGALLRKSAADSESYRANVERYADYPDEPVYDDATLKAIREVKRNAWIRGGHVFFAVLFRPGTFWKHQSSHPVAIDIVFLHLILCIFVLTVLDGVAFGLKGYVDGALTDISWDSWHAFSRLLLWNFGLLGLIFVGSFVVACALSAAKLGFSYARALRFVAYGILPILLVGLVQWIPISYIGVIGCLLVWVPILLNLRCAMKYYLGIEPKSKPIVTLILALIVVGLSAFSICGEFVIL